MAKETPQWSIPRLLATRDQLTLLSLALNLILGAALTLFAIGALTPAPKLTGVVIFGRNGQIAKESVAPFETSLEAHRYCAQQAIKNLFARNPKGFQDPLALKIFLGKAALDKAYNMVQIDSDEFSATFARQLSEFGDYIETHADSKGVTAKVTGQLLRYPLLPRDAPPQHTRFTITLEMVWNPDLIQQGLAPLIVNDFSYAPIR